MAIKKKVAEESVNTEETAPKFSIGKLRSKCLELFGVTTSTFDGATHGLDGEYTVEEMKYTIAKWKNTNIKTKEAK